ncbi:MAG: ATPase domain-containing protein [Candidatus Altiarchaeota archaeon]|nr:ATPase domain-containing protein [Candidatus Altiarchaeota archaeon]
MAPETEIKKVRTGVEGLDKMLNGGLIENRSYIIVGGPGTGKTILSMQFLMEGAKSGEEGLFVSLEESGTELRDDMATFSWDLRRIKIIDSTQELSGKWALKVESVIAGPELTLTNLLTILREYISKYGIKRVVIDSLTSFKLMQKSPVDYRRACLTLMKFLNSVNCTALLTIEKEDHEPVMEEFLSSGVIELDFINHSGEWLNSIRVKKMRGMSMDQHVRPMKITDKGIVVFQNESLYQ